MKKLLLIVLALVLAAANMAFAGQTKSYTIGCTIPAIPGVNAPPYSDQDPGQAASEATAAADNEFAQEEHAGKSGLIQETRESPIMLADGSTAAQNTETLYSR